ncbi:MAG: hypothetical protein AAB229_03490 [Candidatus Hydrogenedentota bacterium]
MDPEFEPARRMYSKPADRRAQPLAESDTVSTVEGNLESPDALSLERILPGVRPRTRQRIASTLKLTGMVRPVPGRAGVYTPEAATVIRQYANLIREGGLSIHDALAVIRGVLADARQEAPSLTSEPPVASQPQAASAPALLVEAEPVATTEASPAEIVAARPEIEKVTQELETLRRIKEDADRREAEFIAEMSRLKGAIERFRNETASLRVESAEIIRDLDEERRNARARIARLEALTRTKPRGLWGRLRAAVGVLFGRSAAIPALPAPRSLTPAPEEELRRAA